MEYVLIRSNRRTLSVETREGRLIVRAPMGATRRQIEDFLAQHRGWIETHLARSEARKEALADVPKLTPEELRQLGERAVEAVPPRVRHYAAVLGVSYGRITIRAQRTKWGSCSSAGNLNFNCLLMLAPPEVLDSIIVHELCHRRHMDHSPAFYDEVLRVFPDYRRCEAWLKQHGPELMARLPA